ncbi:MAG: hypothetical protein PHS81_04620 [Candidatus Nanoarchaeia archaeon]|nr:hypothetical protein [Candidatus Nanoarchaeia archaeon]
MKKSSAITISILILLLALAVLLGLTAFFVDQSVVYPLVLMMDSEINLKCFLSLINLNNQGYIREGETAPAGTLRKELVLLYNIDESMKKAQNYNIAMELGYSGVFTGNEEEFQRLRASGARIRCYTRSFGPAKTGYIALYSE